jgi:hypothetical protein
VAKSIALVDEAVWLSAHSCLFDDLQAASATMVIELEYCTVMDLNGGATLRATDCIIIDGAEPPQTTSPCLRWSSLPADWDLAPHEHCVHGRPCFLSMDFSKRLYGLLSPASSVSIRSGAEDGGELGAYHDSYWLHRLAGVEEKLRSHIPIGITPVLIPDPSLIDAPPGPSPIRV